MATAPGIIIRIGAQTADAIKGINAVNKALGKNLSGYEKFSRNVDRAFVPAVAALGAFGAAAYASAKKASDLAETQNKVNVVLGESADALKKWAKDAPKALGQTEQQALDLASQFAIMGKAAGKTGDELSGFSAELVELSSDWASFANLEPAETAEKLLAALRGEAEPARSLGILLDDAALKAAYFAETGERVTGTLTAQQKVIAAHRAILDQSGDAMGDFERTSDGAANRMRILSATIEQTQTELGAALLPALESSVSALAAMASWARENQTAVKVLAGVLVSLAAAVVAAKVAIIAYETWTKAATIATKLFGTASGTTTGKLKLMRGGAVVAGLAIAGMAAQQTGALGGWQKYNDELDEGTQGLERWMASAVLAVKEMVTGRDAIKGYSVEQRKATSATVAAAIQQGELAGASKTARDNLSGLTAELAANAREAYLAAGSYLALWESIAGAQRAQRDFANTSGTVSSAIAQGAILGPSPTILAKYEKRFTATAESVGGAAGKAAKETEKESKKISKSLVRVFGTLDDGYELSVKALDKFTDKHQKKLGTYLEAANEAVSKYLDNAKDAVRDAQDEYSSGWESVRAYVVGLMDFASVVKAANDTEGDYREAWGQVIQSAEWAANVMRALVADGASEGLIKLVQSSGKDGLVWAEKMIADGFIPQANKDLAQADVWANDAGKAFADQFYGPGVQSAQQMLDGIGTYIDSQLAWLYDKGQQMGATLAAGFNATKPRNGTQGAFTSRGLIGVGPQLRSGGFASYAYAPSGGGQVVNINVSGAVDPVATAKAIQRVLNRGSSRVGVTL